MYGHIRISFTCNGVDKSFVPRCDLGWLDVTVLSLINEELIKKEMESMWSLVRVRRCVTSHFRQKNG